MDIVSLPIELLKHIIQFIPDKDLINFFCCCKLFNSVNVVLTSDFWLNRGLTILCLNPNKITNRDMSSVPDFVKNTYQLISSHLRCFIYQVTRNENKSPISTGHVVYLLKLIQIHDPDNFSKFIINADYFMIPWVKFIVNESKIHIDNILAIPLAFKHINHDDILWKILIRLNYGNKYITIIQFLNNIIQPSESLDSRAVDPYRICLPSQSIDQRDADDHNFVNLLMLLMESYIEKLDVGHLESSDEVLSQFVCARVFNLSFAEELISSRVWKCLYEWELHKPNNVSHFLRMLKQNNEYGFNNLVKHDKGVERDGEVFYLSRIPRNIQFSFLYSDNVIFI